MCAEYEIRTTDKKIEEALQRRLFNESGKAKWDARIKLTDRAPVVEVGAEGLVLRERVFPSSPFPNSRLSGVDRDEAEEAGVPLKRIYEMPTWKEGFQRRRCLAVMTGFLEPVYWGDEAGSVMNFHVPDAPVFFVAAIAITPKFPKTGKVDGFSLLTHTATKQMLTYHHRMLVVLKPAAALEYIDRSLSRPRDIFEFLLEHRYSGQLEVEKDRTMAKGWQNRVELHEAALAREIRYMDALKKEDVGG